MKYKYFLALYCLIFIFKMSSTVLKYNCIGFDVLRIYRTLAFHDGLRKINLFSSVLMFWQPNGYYNACIMKGDQAYLHGYKTKALYVLPKVLSNRLDNTMSFLTLYNCCLLPKIVFLSCDQNFGKPNRSKCPCKNQLLMQIQ